MQNAKNDFVAVEKQAEISLTEDGTFTKFADLAKKKDRHLAFCTCIINEYWPVAVDFNDPNPDHIPKSKEWLEFNEELYKTSNQCKMGVFYKLFIQFDENKHWIKEAPVKYRILVKRIN